jgi:hypothetical protein
LLSNDTEKMQPSLARLGQRGRRQVDAVFLFMMELNSDKLVGEVSRTDNDNTLMAAPLQSNWGIGTICVQINTMLALPDPACAKVLL